MQRGSYLPQATASRGDPSASAKPHSPAPPCHQRSSAPRDRDAAVRHHSRPHSRQVVQTPTAAAIQPAHGVRSCRSGKHLTGQSGQPKGIIKLAIGQQFSIGRDDGTAKLQPQPAVKIEPKGTGFRLTRRAPHRGLPQSQTSCGSL